jgi:LPXTG-site transpeptidase (sortase) family protein
VTFKLRVKVADGLPTATYAVKNTLKAASDTPEVDLTDNTSEDTNTGSGSPNVSITLSVTPTSVRTAQNATYTIKVTNSGTAPVTEATVTDTFSTFVDIVSATTSKGSTSVNTSQRKVTATIGTLGSNSTATVTVVVKVNSSAKSNQTVSNTASVSYKFGGAVSTKNSTTVNFALVVASSLPGTGGIEPSARPPGSRAHLPALISAVLLAVLGVAALSYALWARSRRPEWAIWAGRMGGLFLGVAVSFGVIGWALMRFALPQQAAMVTPPPAAPAETAAPPVHHDDPAWVGLAPSGGLEKLPDYPVPTPTYQATPGEPGPDVSAVARLELPTIGVDTIVKYVPFDGLTWMIAGLQHEVAWMGETSWPGLGGNTALAGHVSLRTGDDGPFRHLDKLQTGDAVVVYTEENQYIYRVRERIIAEDTNLSVLAQTTASQLTLITCTNWDGIVGFYRDRLVVYADLKEVIPLDAQALAR